MTKIDNRLYEKLCCPACKGKLQYEDKPSFLCAACGRSFPIIANIPELLYYPDGENEQSNFNNSQAQYERDIHERDAEIYEDRIVKVWGDKTELIATEWAKMFPGPVLDYGCGTGQLSRVLKQCHSPVYAFDISSVSLCKNIKDNNVLAVIANAFHLPFGNRSFETVCCNGVLHHIIDLRAVITEMARIANRFILISEPCTVVHYRFPLLRRTAKVILQATGLLGFARQLRQYLRLSDDSGSSKSRDSGGSKSKYERGLEPHEVIELLEGVGFGVRLLRFWTNLNWRRRSRIKRVLMRMLVSNKTGTHFEIRAERCRHDDG